MCFGGLDHFTAEAWKPMTRIFTMCECELIKMDREFIRQMFADYERSLKTESLIELLSSQITAFDKLSHNRRVKVAQAFKEVTYSQGKVLMEEGKLMDPHAYLLTQGKCKMVVHKNPL